MGEAQDRLWWGVPVERTGSKQVGVPKRWERLWKVLEVSMGGSDESAKEQEVLGGAEWRIWVIFLDEVGDVACKIFYPLKCHY